MLQKAVKKIQSMILIFGEKHEKILIQMLIYLLFYSLSNMLTQVMLEIYSLNSWQIEFSKFLIFMLLVFLHVRYQKGKK